MGANSLKQLKDTAVRFSRVTKYKEEGESESQAFCTAPRTLVVALGAVKLPKILRNGIVFLGFTECYWLSENIAGPF